MMKLKLLFVLSIVCLCVHLVSCSNDEERVLEPAKTPGCIDNKLSRFVHDDELTDIILYGYTTRENKKDKKVLISKEFANATGLQVGGVYIIRNERYTMTVPLNNQCFFESEYNDGCGLKTMSDPVDGSFVSMERGYNEVSQNDLRAIIECYLIHVISDMSGRSINIYYPCVPDQIEWRGYLYNL